MSCIAGILNLDGAPVDRELLERMTGAMKSRAPDASSVWVSGNVGFGHALLRISPESENEHQPCTLDGQVWITADARIDGRAELVGKLRAAGEQVGNDAPDAELILHAYQAFGASFLGHLIGDFAFALWDGREKKLICARDHFGVRPFYYARVGRAIVFASHIEALLRHPAVSTRLDEEAIGDFLLFGSCQQPELSIYQDIRCLPAASFIKSDAGGFRVKAYWELPQHSEIRYRKNSDYLEHFQEIFSRSVGDRMRAPAVAIELSGGMDSTSIAAIAAEKAKAGACKLTAFTVTCHDLLPEDQEGHFAAMVAEHLHIPLVCQPLGEYALFERADSPLLRTAEPVANPDLAVHYDKWKLIADSGAHVLLTGQGGDAVFNGSSTYYAYLLKSGRVFSFFSEIARHVINTGSFSGMGLRTALLGPVPDNTWQPPFPDWINEDFSGRVNLRERWERGWKELNGPSDAYHQLKRPWLSRMFEGYEVIQMPLVVRHPFFDIRLVAFLLGLPNHMKPDKKLMREAMRGKLPEPVRVRPKTSLAGDQFRPRFSGDQWRTRMESWLIQVGGVYVDRGRYLQAFEKYQAGHGAESTWTSWLVNAPPMLDIWLAGRGSKNVG